MVVGNQIKTKKTPRIIIDARMVSEHPHGIARFVKAVAEGFEELKPLPYDLVFLFDQEFSLSGELPWRNWPFTYTKTSFLTPSEAWRLPFLLKNLDADLYHSTSFSSLLWSPCPYGLTIHDLNHIHFGGLFKKLYYRFLLKPFALKANFLSTVSDFSRKEISTWLNISSDRLSLTYNAVEKMSARNENVEEVLRRFSLKPDGYFFTLSNSKPHKNLNSLTRGYGTYQRRSTNPLPLVLSVNGESKDGILRIGRVSDAEISVLCENSKAFFFPSMYEGAGLPPLEAALKGARVVLSDIPPHRELFRKVGASDDMIWVKPLDYEGWASSFSSAQQGDLQPLSSETRRRIEETFSPKNLALELDKIYRKVLKI